MADPPSQQQQSRKADYKSKPSHRTANPTTRDEPVSESNPTRDVAQQFRGDQIPGMKVGEVKVSAGRMGERNVTIEMDHVRVGNDLPCRFIVRTLVDNGLEVIVEQLAYRKQYTGTGTVSTLVIPVVPIGTMGRLTVRDTTTGETIEEPWTWVMLGGSGLFSRLWAAIKRALWNPAD